MNVRMKIAFGLYFLAGLLLVSFGIVYLFREEFMPYHSVAVGMPWAEVPPNFQVLILALMKVLGGTIVALTLALYIVLFVPFRQGARWAVWAAPLPGLVQIVGTFYAMSHVALNTPASPPFSAPAVGAILTIIAFALSESSPSSK